MRENTLLNQEPLQKQSQGRLTSVRIRTRSRRSANRCALVADMQSGLGIYAQQRASRVDEDILASKR